MTRNGPAVTRGCGREEEMIIKGNEGQFWGVLDVFYVLILVEVIWMYACTQIHRIVNQNE